MNITMLVKDTSGKAISGATITVTQWFVADKTAISGNQGSAIITGITLEGVSDWVTVSVTKTGYESLKIDVFKRTPMPIEFRMAATAPPPPAPTPPPPIYDPPTSEKWEGQITTACDVYTKTAFGENWFKYRQKYNGFESKWYLGYDKMKEAGLADNQCHASPPAPAPAPAPAPDYSGRISAVETLIAALTGKITDAYEDIASMAMQIANIVTRVVNLEKTVSTLYYDIVNGVVNRVMAIESRLTSIDNALQSLSVGLRQNVIEWISDAFISIIEKALDREVKR